MAEFIKDALNEIAISGIRQFNQKANNVEDVIKLTLGELDFNTPDPIKDAVTNALNNNYTKYTENMGLLELRKKIALKYDFYHDDEIIITVGTTEGLSIIIKSIINAGDEVIIPTPAYVGYKPLITIEKGVVKELDVTKADFKITKAALEESYSSKTKALIITNPNNPTGLILTDEEMDIIKDFVLEKDILLIADEIYSQIDFENKFTSFTKYKTLKDNLLCLNGFSKSHAMTGFRIGYILGEALIIKDLLKTHQYSVTSATSISQHAALKACDVDTSYMTKELKERKAFLCQKLDEIGLTYIEPKGAFYVFCDISKYSKSSIAFCEELLFRYKVAVIPGEAFLGDNKNYIRISYATNIKVLTTALNRIKDYIEALKTRN
jgi:aminotransferase